MPSPLGVMKGSIKWPDLRDYIDTAWNSDKIKVQAEALTNAKRLLNEEIEGATITLISINKTLGEWEVTIEYTNSNNQNDQENQILEAIKSTTI